MTNVTKQNEEQNTGLAKQDGQRKKSAVDKIKDLMSSEEVAKRFRDLLGKRAQGFIVSVMQVVSSNDLLKKADPHSVYAAAATAAVLDLPLNNNFGFAYIVPYAKDDIDEQGNRIRKQFAQFQMGYKGFIQLAQRSGLFKTISVTEVYEGQLIEENPLTGFAFDFTKKTSNKIIGYASYFELLNGFQKTMYMTKEMAEAHGKKYSQTYKQGFGLWKTDFDTMAMKTVMKLLLSKYAPLSIEMQRAVVADQAVINDIETQDIEYVDNDTKALDPVAQALEINSATTQIELKKIQPFVLEENTEIWADKMAELKKSAKSGKAGTQAQIDMP